jgi:hypothetical protein
MFRLYIFSIHQVGYKPLNRESVKIQYSTTVETIFAATESEDIHKLVALFAHAFEVFRLYCCTVKTKATHITLLPTELI